MKRILCFGDSNTWGYIPGTGERYAPDVRWTGVAQKLLGDDYLLIEEGLNGRTTMYPHPCKPWQTGIGSLEAILHSQKPIDLMILMLGTNDLWRTDAFGAGEGIKYMLETIFQHHKTHRPIPESVFADEARILLVSPIEAHPVLNDHDGFWHRMAAEESRKFPRIFRKIAADAGVDFLNAAEYAEPSAKDGVHMEADSHQRLGEAMAEKIREMLG